MLPSESVLVAVQFKAYFEKKAAQQVKFQAKICAKLGKPPPEPPETPVCAAAYLCCSRCFGAAHHESAVPDTWKHNGRAACRFGS